jgi:hypothetical protein
MKPLTKSALNTFLERFGYFKDGEIREIEIKSPTNIFITIAAQDESRAYDWVTVKLEFEGVSSASLIENNQLQFLDMSDGIDINNNNNYFTFGIKSATLHIESLSLKYDEGSF